MRTEGVTLEAHTLRATEIRGGGYGRAVLRRQARVTVAAQIVAGTHGFADRFTHWEFRLERPGWRKWLPDPELKSVLGNGCAVEMWTRQDDQWIHWLFPATTWTKNRRAWAGRSHTSMRCPTVDDFPEGGPALADGGFWKTLTPPPERTVT